MCIRNKGGSTFCGRLDGNACAFRIGTASRGNL